ncbi:MAG: hypothetical protein WCQ60_02635 [bacterium]
MQPNESGVKPWQWIVTVIVVIVLIILGFYIFNGKSAAPASTETPATTETTTSNNANGIAVSDQFPGNIVYISSVQLAAPGFVAIQTNSNGTPGKVIGSQYFKAGINPGQVNLTQSMLDGSSYYAVLYSDTNGNGKFDATSDVPVKDTSGNIIMKIFHATSNVQQVKG